MPALKINRTSATKLRNGGRTTHFEMCVSEGDPALIVEILGDIARAHGVAKLAQETGLSNEYLDQLISPEGSPEFSAIITLVKALGLSLHARNR